MNKLISQNPQPLIKIIRWLIAIVAVVYLVYTLAWKQDSEALLTYVNQVFAQNPKALFLILALMPLNWILEAIKWRYLFQETYKLSFWQSIKGVLIGVYVSLFTPNGIGEFAGRMWVAPADHHEEAASSTVAGSMSQLAITITIGGACLVFMLGNFWLFNFPVFISIASAVTVIIGLVTFFNMSTIIHWIFKKISFYNRFRTFVETFEKYRFKQLLTAYILSLIRYLVYCLQIFILIKLTVSFNPAIDVFTLFMAIPIYLYIKTLIPTIALGEVGIRGAVLTSLLWKLGATTSASIVLSTTLIWLINIVFPAILGMILSFRTSIRLRKS